jgi:heterodisulfide reductase subunit A
LSAKVEGAFDLVVLSTALIPTADTTELAKKLGIQVGSDGFLLEKHYKLKPVDSQREGMFVAGCALSPKDIRETTLEAMSTASRVATFVGKGEISVSPEIAYINPAQCDNSEVCITVCPVGAVEKSSTEIRINPMSCVGCGICVPRCPRGAIDLRNCTEDQLMAQIEGVSKSTSPPKIIAFLEKEIAYGAADLAGQSRVEYPPNVEIIGVPSTGRIGLKHVLHAFASGADGVLLLEDHGGVFTEEALREHAIQMKKQLREYAVKPLRLMSFSTTLPEYGKVTETFKTFHERISRIGPITKETREKIKAKLAEL